MEGCDARRSFDFMARPSSCSLRFMADVHATPGWMAIGGDAFWLHFNRWHWPLYSMVSGDY